MPSKFAFRQVDKGWKALRQAAKTIKQGASYVKVGVLGSDKDRDDGRFTNVQIGIVHEYGAPGAGIPERSWLRSTFEAKKPDYIAMLKVLVPRVYAQEMSVKRMLGLVGAKAAADCKATIRGGIPPPLSPETIRKKGSDLPLVDTGQLLTSISYVVVLSGGEVK